MRGEDHSAVTWPNALLLGVVFGARNCGWFRALMPSARNKMYNARLKFMNYGSSEVQRTMAPRVRADIEKNAELATELIATSLPARIEISVVVDREPLDLVANVSFLQPDGLARFVRWYRWAPGYENCMQLVMEFLEGKHGDPGIERWLMVAPQAQRSPFGHWKPLGLGTIEFTIRERSRNEDNTRYLVYSEPDHIKIARFYAGVAEGKATSAAAQRLVAPRQGVLLLYPVLSQDEHDKGEPANIGFVLWFPRNGIARKLAYTVLDPTQKDAVVVDAPKPRASKRSSGD